MVFSPSQDLASPPPPPPQEKKTNANAPHCQVAMKENSGHTGNTSHISNFTGKLLVVVRKTDEGGEATRSTPVGTLPSFGSAETGSLGAEEILNTVRCPRAGWSG